MASARIVKRKKLSDGSTLVESYKPEEYLVLLIIRMVFKYLIFIYLRLPYFILKLLFLIVRFILSLFLNKDNKFLQFINKENFTINQLSNFKIFN